jgi:hypothetical protein
MGSLVLLSEYSIIVPHSLILSNETAIDTYTTIRLYSMFYKSNTSVYQKSTSLIYVDINHYALLLVGGATCLLRMSYPTMRRWVPP